MSRVLFVCVGNQGRSVLAEQLFRRAVGGRHDVRSAGSRPGRETHAAVLDALAEVGIDASAHRPEQLDDEHVRWADVVVATCDDACPVIAGKRYFNWQLPDPIDRPLDEVRALRDDVAARIDELVAELDRDHDRDDTERALVDRHVELFNAGVRSGDFGPMVAQFTDDAELVFVFGAGREIVPVDRSVQTDAPAEPARPDGGAASGAAGPVGPFRGRESIAAAYRGQPPDDEITVSNPRTENGELVVDYTWLANPDTRAGELRITEADDRIARLVVTFDA